jgi:hypothetical protein
MNEQELGEPRTITATELRLWIAHEDQAGNFHRANALRCALNWLDGGSYVVAGASHE